MVSDWTRDSRPLYRALGLQVHPAHVALAFSAGFLATLAVVVWRSL